MFCFYCVIAFNGEVSIRFVTSVVGLFCGMVTIRFVTFDGWVILRYGHYSVCHIQWMSRFAVLS